MPHVVGKMMNDVLGEGQGREKAVHANASCDVESETENGASSRDIVHQQVVGGHGVSDVLECVCSHGGIVDPHPRDMEPSTGLCLKEVPQKSDAPSTLEEEAVYRADHFVKKSSQASSSSQYVQ